MTRPNALHFLKLAGFGCLVGAWAAPGVAQEESFYYAGVSLGQSRARIDDERITANLLRAGLTTTSMSRDEHDTAYKVFGGYQFNRSLALEGGYFDLGKFGYSSTTVPAGTVNGQIKVQGLNLDVVGTWPLTPRVSALGRLGAQYADVRVNFRGDGAAVVTDPNPSKRSLGYKFGVGLQFEISPSVLLRAEGERHRIDDAVGNHGDVDLFSVSLLFPIGRSPRTVP